MKLFGNKYRYLFILLLASYSYVNTAYLETFDYYGIREPKLYIWLTFLLIVAIVWEGNRLLEGLILSRKSESNSKIHPLVVLFLSSLILSAATGWLAFYGMSRMVTGQEQQLLPVEAKLSTVFALRVNLFLQCLNGIMFFINRSRQKELETEALRRTTTQAMLQSIRSQVNPHFLFNNLNVLSALIMTKNDQANEFIEAFSSVYRYILNHQEDELVTLQQELDFLGPYIFLLEKRFDRGLVIEKNIPENYKHYYIIPIALQILFENAIKHNIVSVHQPLVIQVFIDDENNIVVRNNLQQKPPDEASTMTGLSNISKRYEMTMGRKIRIHQDQDIFEVALPLIEKIPV
jgi:two-component system, LytTR family, sensor kinase